MKKEEFEEREVWAGQRIFMRERVRPIL